MTTYCYLTPLKIEKPYIYLKCIDDFLLGCAV